MITQKVKKAVIDLEAIRRQKASITSFHMIKEHGSDHVEFYCRLWRPSCMKTDVLDVPLMSNR